MKLFNHHIMLPPGFREQRPENSTNIDSPENACMQCKHYSSVYDGYCIRHDYKILGRYPICEEFFPYGKSPCPFCGDLIEEACQICPTCGSSLNKVPQNTSNHDLNDSQLNDNSSTSLTPNIPESPQLPILEEIPTYSDAFLTKFEYWKNNLLDMSKRNKQLYFKPNAKNVVEILHPKLRDIFGGLTIQRNIYRFIKVYKKPLPRSNNQDYEEEIEESKPILETEMDREQIKKKTKGNQVSKKTQKNSPSKDIQDTIDSNNDFESDKTGTRTIDQTHLDAIKKALSKATETDIVTSQEDRILENVLNRMRINARQSLQEQGINSVYITFGVLKWWEPGEKEPSYSPILFLPIVLNRDLANHSYTLELYDDDVVINPSLLEKLRTSIQIELPSFPDAYESDDLKRYLRTVETLLISQENWVVEDRIYLGQYAFNKLGMYSDLIKNKYRFFHHPIIRSIAEGGGFNENPSHLPKAEELDDNIHPLSLYSVLDNDLSQLRAITYAEMGASLVIRGPPGTGKSQTITNIIAECLSCGKKVLFVAQKMAALQVVKKRLDATGLGEFCLEIHSNKSNKVDVLKQISRSLGTSLKAQRVPVSKYEKHKFLQNKLNYYIDAIHSPVERMEHFDNDNLSEKSKNPNENMIPPNSNIPLFSIFQRTGELSHFKEIPYVSAEIPSVLELSMLQIIEIQDLLGQLDIHECVWDKYSDHPWAKAKIQHFEPGMKAKLTQKLLTVIQNVNLLNREIAVLNRRFEFKPIISSHIIEQISEFFSTYSPKALGLDILLLESRFQTVHVKVFRFLNPSFYQDQKILKNTVKRWELLPPLEHIRQIRSFKETYLNLGTNLKPDVFFEGIDDQVNLIINILNDLKRQSDELHELFIPELNPILASDDHTPDWVQYYNMAQYWISQMGVFDEWCEFQIIWQELEKYRLGAFLQKANEIKIPADQLPEVFMKSYIRKWIEAATTFLPELNNFNSKYHESLIQKFRVLDQELLNINRYRLCEMLFKQRPSALWINCGDKSSQMGLLSRELMKKRNIKPLRGVFKETKDFLMSIKPCLLMSPLSVSNYLDAEEFYRYFDLVIFDEASQICPEDAIGAMYRAKQVIVVGDEKQLPPTRFFASQETSDDLDDSQVDMFESILEECIGIGLPVLTLNNHYRSKKEGLIAFSNLNYYNQTLNTFPDTLRSGIDAAESLEDMKPIDFVFVPEGVYEKGTTRKNRIEAYTVAKAVIAHFQRNQDQGTHYSLGVIAFSEAQQEAIQSAVDKLMEEQLELDAYIENNYVEEDFFVKNLENVQGDERDFIFFSIGYAKPPGGKLSINFGPLNRAGGERRLNVAITRARYHNKIFCSFQPHELDVARSSSQGLKDLFAYLKYAQNPTQLQYSPYQEFNLNTDLLDDIEYHLKQRGYTTDRNVGKSANRLDLAIVNPGKPSHYLLGIQCDGGAYYHFRTSSRDRERIRIQMLETLGWQIYHLWTLDWVFQRETVLDEIENLIKIGRPKKIEMRQEEKNDIEKDVEKEANNEQFNPQFLQNEKPKDLQNDLLEESGNVEVTYEQKELDLNGTKKTQQRDPEFRKKYFQLKGIQPYQSFTKTRKGISGLFYEDPDLLFKISAQILETEGPISWDLFNFRIMNYFDIQRASPKFKETMIQVLQQLKDAGYKITPTFYYPKESPDHLIRICLDPKEEPRYFKQISPIELRNAMGLLLDMVFSIDIDEFCRKLLDLYGYSALTADYREHCLKYLIPLLTERGGSIKGNVIMDPKNDNH